MTRRRPQLFAVLACVLAWSTAHAEPSPDARPAPDAVPTPEVPVDDAPDTAEPVEPDVEPVPQVPGDTSGAGAFGLELLGGAATLGGIAGCRGAEFAKLATPPPLAGFAIRGELVDDAGDLQSFVQSALAASRTPKLWSEDSCRALRSLTDKLRYTLELIENQQPDGVHLVIGLRPTTQVRHVRLHGNLSFLELPDPIYQEELIRRMRLRPGDNIEDEPEKRRAELAAEEKRILEYLARHGYFDATVKVTALPAEDAHQVTLRIDMHKGAGYTIGKIEVVGNNEVTTDEIAELMAQKICPLDVCLLKRRFSYDRLKTDLDKVRELYQKRGYPGMRVRSDFSLVTSPDHDSKTVRLKLTVTERKKIDVAFDGVHHKSLEDLKLQLTFNAAGAYDDFEAQNSAEAVRRRYQGEGRFQTLVNFERVHLPNDTDRITFHVDEGSEEKIAAITITGNDSFPTAKLKTVISARPFPGFFGLIGSGGYVTSLQLQLDLDALVAFYQAQGFAHVQADVQVANDAAVLGNAGATAAQIAADDPGHGLYLRYDIVEGVRDVVKSVDFFGNDALDGDVLRIGKPKLKLTLKPGVPYTAAAVNADIEVLRRLYLEKGYLTVAITPVVTGSGPDVKVTYKIREGKPVHFGRLIVRGNYKTKSWVLVDQLGLEKGDLLTIDALDRGTFQLGGTNLFSSVHPPQLIGRDPVDMIIDVEERYDNFADAEVGGGYSTDYSAFISGTFGLRNLGGSGIDFILTSELGLKRTRLQATLALPQWVMWRGTRIPFKLELTARYRSDDTPRFGSLTTEGFTANLSRKLSTGVYLSFKYDLNRFGRNTELTRPAGADQDLKTSPINTTTASLGPTLVIDQRGPSPFIPSYGYLISLSAAVASTALLGTDNFIKVDIAAQHFLPLGNRVVITNTLRYDQGFPLGGSVLLPDVERFTAGGDTTVRGYEDERLHTEIIKNPLDPATGLTSFRVLPAGGNIRMIHNLDVQIRVIDQLSIASAIFLDSGIVMNSWNGFNVGKIRQGLGIALARWLSPIGSFSLEYAFPLQPEIGDDPTGRVHFNFGFGF